MKKILLLQAILFGILSLGFNTSLMANTSETDGTIIIENDDDIILIEEEE